MATKEFIQKRIEGKQREIAKLTAKLERINKAEATGWEVNPYGYYESDKKWALRDLADAQEVLAEYQAKLIKAEEKEASRNVPAITEFLNNWKTRMTEFYNKRFSQYPAAQKQFEEDMKPYQMNYFQESKFRRENPEGWRTWSNEKKRIKGLFEARFGCLEPYIERKYNPDTHMCDMWELDADKLEKDLQAEWERKYDFIIDRTNEIVGKITDASNLTIGNKDDLNGYIIGTKGTAKVQTIGAGGYNIQCFHFRTLINPWTAPQTKEEQPKKTESKTQKTSTQMSYKDMTIEELEALLKKLGGTCKVYEDQRIYRMRLVMAIKKVG